MNAKIIRKTPFGPVAIVWQKTGSRPVIARVLLSRTDLPADHALRRQYPHAAIASCAKIDAVAKSIQALLAGEAIRFPLDLVALDSCPRFHQAVLRATHGIPRGQVRTYGQIAAQLGQPGAARAVGNALARNPFPLVIPCHRVIRANGRLGGFGGGPGFKRALLAREGVEMDSSGQITDYHI